MDTRRTTFGGRYLVLVVLIMFSANYLSNRNLPILIAMMIAFCVVHLCAAEFIPAKRSRGEILLFPRRYGKRLRKESDAGDTAKLKTFAQDLNAENPVVSKKEYRVIAGEKDSVETIQRQSAVFHWSHLNYDIKTKDGQRRILDDLSGWVKPGTLTALMVRNPCSTALHLITDCRPRGSLALGRRAC